MKWLLLIGIAIECWYWFIYFPRAWRDGSNREINDIRRALETARKVL